MRAPPLTTERRLEAGAVLRHGASSAYRKVEVIAGEPHLLREDFAAGETAGPPRPLACLVHITDLQLADVQSPTRFEFLNRYFADPRYAGLVPVQRPQEALTVHAVDAMLRTVNGLRGPATGRPVQLAVTTGDAIDNAQWNEVQTFLALFEGGLVRPDSGAPGYAGVQALDWPDDIFWKPDGAGPGGPDFFRREFGFPHCPGLLDRALRQFAADGLRIPWLSCYGNHEALNQGVGAATPGLAAALTGGRKPLGLPDGFDSEHALELFTVSPEAFMAGPSRAVPADPGRRPVTGGSSWPRTSGRMRGPPGTASPSRTGSPARPTTCTTHPRCGSSRWTPTAWPAGRTVAWTSRRPGGWRTGWPRCTRPTAAGRASRSALTTRTGWSCCSPTMA